MINLMRVARIEALLVAQKLAFDVPGTDKIQIADNQVTYHRNGRKFCITVDILLDKPL